MWKEGETLCQKMVSEVVWIYLSGHLWFCKDFAVWPLDGQSSSIGKFNAMADTYATKYFTFRTAVPSNYAQIIQMSWYSRKVEAAVWLLHEG